MMRVIKCVFALAILRDLRASSAEITRSSPPRTSDTKHHTYIPMNVGLNDVERVRQQLSGPGARRCPMFQRTHT